MFKHILVAAANKENSEIIAESYFQVNLFGKQLKLFKRRTNLTVKQKEHKPTDDYISIRIPKYGDKPIVQMRGERAVNASEGIESVKFVWVTKDSRGANMDIPFMDVKLLHGADDGEFVRLLKGVGSEIEAETLRQTINLSKHTKEMYRLLNVRDLICKCKEHHTHDNDLPFRPEVSE